MSHTKHTPGPWFTDATNDTIFILSPARRGAYVAQIEKMGSDAKPIEDAGANARLIAAAPELLTEMRVIKSFLGDCVKMLKNDSEARDLYYRVEALIARIEGGAE